jgi:hypothetical protein
MKEYFLLQYKITNRKLSDAGVNPAIGYVLGVIGFILISEYVFQKTELAKYLVLLIASGVQFKMSEKNRNEFLLLVFGNNKTRKIRIAENLILSLPFSIILIYHNTFLESTLLTTASILLASVSFKTGLNITIPTPFYKKPFEFTVGFRNTFYVFPLAYILTGIAISVDNLNLGIFALLLVFLVSVTYYVKPENEYFVWSYSTTPHKFLLEKLLTATKYSFFSATPICIGLIAFYPGEAGFILLFLLIGLSFLWTIILAKYSAYPNEMNLPEVILIAICMYFPPGLLAVIPFFYTKSVTKLNTLLK